MNPKIVIHTSLDPADAEVLRDFCNDNRVSMSAVIKVLVTDFLDNANKSTVDRVLSEACKIKLGRPKQEVISDG